MLSDSSKSWRRLNIPFWKPVMKGRHIAQMVRLEPRVQRLRFFDAAGLGASPGLGPFAAWLPRSFGPLFPFKKRKPSMRKESCCPHSPVLRCRRMWGLKTLPLHAFLFLWLYGTVRLRVFCVLFAVEAKDRDAERLMEEKDLDLEEMKKRLKDQERERQSELLKLQMEVKQSFFSSYKRWSKVQ